MLRIAVVGGGINGIMTAWRLAALGHHVELYDRGPLMYETSRASTKLLHGGLRYLEQGELRLVYESLHERTWWTAHAPQLAKPIRLVLPVYRGAGRPRWLLGLGLTLYDVLAGRHSFGRHHWHPHQALLKELPHLRSDNLIGGYTFHDAQMDDYALGRWAASQAHTAGVVIHESTAVTKIGVDGTLTTAHGTHHYDRIVNVAGPWAKQLLDASGIPAEHTLDLVRGSHIVLPNAPDAPLHTGLLVQVPGERRICFILPYQGNILVGTTEVRQPLDTPPHCSDEERRYLLAVYNDYFTDTRTDADILTTFAGVRPLLHSATDPTKASREYALERQGHVVTIFGGKWTTSRVLAQKAAALALHA